MNKILRELGTKCSSAGFYRYFSLSATSNSDYSCKLLIVGGGTGGCTIAAKFARTLPQNAVIVLEPSTDHYYQPLFTLVGGGVTPLSKTGRPEASVLPDGAKWVQEAAASIDPKQNVVETTSGRRIEYEYLVVAVGLNNDYNKVPGLLEALKDKSSGVSTIYSPDYCEKTWSDIKNFSGGDAIFTFPDTPIKCPGAPQKIAYLAESYFAMTNIRSRSKISYDTCMPVIFGVKKYADALVKVAARKRIDVNYRSVLREIRPDTREAVFENMENNQKTTRKYDLLHVTPPMRTPDVLRQAEGLTDGSGFLSVDKHTLQHVNYPNVYGIGDCTNTPNSKTAAAIAKQCCVLERNLSRTMRSQPASASYDGYGACPLVTSYDTVIMAEFTYDGVPRETFPYDQSKESSVAFYMKKHLFPFLYWNVMLKGYYHGPEFVRKIVNPFAK